MRNDLTHDLESDVASFLQYILHERRLAENTFLAYKRGLERFEEFVRIGGVADYLAPRPSEVAAYAEWLLKKGLSPSTRQLAAIALKMFYKRLVAMDWLSDDQARPVEAMALPKIPERLPKVLNVEDVLRLMDAPSKKCPMYLLHKALLEFLFASACRASEVVGLRIDNLDLVEATCRVLGKGQKERIIPLGEYAVQALNAYLHLLRPHLVRHQTEPPPWVFVSRSGLQLDREFLWIMVHGYAKKVGLPGWVGAHSLRHAALTALVKGGCDLRFVQELAGHAHPGPTSAYLHMDIAHIRRAHERFEAYRQQTELSQETFEETLPQSAQASAKWLPLTLKLQRKHSFWSSDEDDLVRSLPPDEVVLRTGRSLNAVKTRRRDLRKRDREQQHSDSHAV